MLPPTQDSGGETLGLLASTQLDTSRSLLSPEYMVQPRSNCFMLLTHLMACARPLALAKAGSNIAARMAMMAMTTNSSISVNPCELVLRALILMGVLNWFIIEQLLCGDTHNMAYAFLTTMDKNRSWIDFFNKQLGTLDELDQPRPSILLR